MTAYYNEFDPFAAEWLRQLIKAGHIADGVVDERDMREIEPAELRGFTQCHFFAGIGGWSYALRLAGWPDSRPVWTGSPPCQPFSLAGLGKGKDDERHLAPHFLELVKAGRPPVLFGEQVAAAVKKDNWLDDLLDALESENYTTGAAVLSACGVGAPHIRQRTWFVAERVGDSIGEGLEGHARHGNNGCESRRQQKNEAGPVTETGCDSRLADCDGHGGCKAGEHKPETRCNGATGDCAAGRVADTESIRSGTGPCNQEQTEERGIIVTDNGCNSRSGTTNGQWSAPDWLYCRDEKWRPVESGTFPLADGIPARVGRLRGYGNAIVPQVAAEIIKAYQEQEV